MSKQRMSTANKMILTTLVFVAVVFIAMIIIVANILFSNSIEQSKKADTENANRLTDSLKENFSSVSRLLRLAQQSFAELDFYDGNAHESVGNILTSLLELDPTAHCAWFIAEPGIHHDNNYCISEYLRQNETIIANDAEVLEEYLKDPETASWYYDPLQTGKMHVEALNLIDYGTGEDPAYNAIISVPIYGDGEIIGVCGIDVIYNDLLDLPSPPLGQNRTVMLISRDMTILQAHDQDMIGKNLAEIVYKDTGDMHKAMMSNEPYAEELTRLDTGEIKFVYLQPIPFYIDEEQDSLYLYISTPLHELRADAYNTVLILVTVSFFCMMFLLAIIFFNVKRIIKPVRTLTRQAQQVTSGDFGLEIFSNSESAPDNRNEVEVLRFAFIKLLHELQDNLHTVENRVLERTQELTTLNHYVKRLMESTSNVSIFFDPDFNIVYCSDNLLRYLRVSDFSEISGVHWHTILDMFFDEDYGIRSKERMQRILSGENRLVEDDAAIWPDETVRLYRIICTQVKDEKDNIEGFVVVMLDLTDVRQEEAQRRQDDLIHSTKIPCMVWNEEGEIIAINDEFTRVFDLPGHISFDVTEEFLSIVQPEFQPDGCRTSDLRQSVVDSAIENGFAQANVRLSKADGTPVYCLINVARISWLSDHRLVVYCYDRTDLVLREAEVKEMQEREQSLKLQKEAAQAANDAKGQFLAHMSHEIRTPMNAVLGMSELLLQESLSAPQFRYVKDIRTSAEALLEIINDILDVSKIQAGKLSLIPVHYDFETMLDNISSIARFLVEDKGITFMMDIHGETSICLYGDDVRLRQVLLNLLSNAVKFTKEGQVTLTVQTTDSGICFTVRDSGIGVKEKDIEKLFDDFEQFDARKNRDKTGTGLGLSITKSLVEMMDGSISVESVYGEGTSFQISIPKILGDKSLIKRADSNEIVINAPDAKVLVVDDNPINLNVACGLLRLCGINAETASSGQQAIDLVAENQYDIVFMDQMMPAMDGLETTGLIREMGINVPIIALTACAIPGTKELMLDAGMDDYLTKPIISLDLKQKLQKWLPAEKQLNSFVVLPESADTAGSIDAEAPEDTLLWEKLGQIDGLFLSVGLERVEGQHDVYQEILKAMIKEIDKCVRNLDEFLASGDMHGFRIEAHSIKSALTNTGFMELAESALELETASGEENTSYCASTLPSFLRSLLDIRTQLSEVFSFVSDRAA